MADAGEAAADSYQKLRQIYRDIQAGAKAFLAAEYRMCLAFLVVFAVRRVQMRLLHVQHRLLQCYHSATGLERLQRRQRR